MTEVGDHQSLVASLKQAAYFHLFKVMPPCMFSNERTDHALDIGTAPQFVI